MVEKVRLPGVSQDEHARRRAQVFEQIGDDVMILAAGTAPTYSNDTEYRFRPNSDFFYLTGFYEEDAVAVFKPGSELPYTLFVRPRDPEAEVWTGRRLGPEGAKREFGADASYEIEQIAEQLGGLLDGARTLYYDPWQDASLDAKIKTALGGLRRKERFGPIAPETLVRPAALLHEMRLIKSAEEIAMMAQAAEISAKGHLAGMAYCRPGVMEYQIQSVIEQCFLDDGAAGPGYASIVGAGENGCILHYIENNQRVNDGDLLLVDAGAEYGGYNGDITRTYPVSGKFTPAQRDLYDVVHSVLLAGIAASKPGATIDGIHEHSLRMLSEGMVSLGLLEGSTDEIMESESYKKFYMHRTSHWLGMDVHDVGLYRQEGASRPLLPGMLYTVEPGIYVQPWHETAPEELRGQAVRLEDNILITEDGHRNLTTAVPTEADDVAALVGKDAGS